MQLPVQATSNESTTPLVQDRSFTLFSVKIYRHATRCNGEKQMNTKFTKEQRDTYVEIGGAPHLDAQYTVFGEIIEGYDVIDKIAGVETNDKDRPVEDVKIIKITVVE